MMPPIAIVMQGLSTYSATTGESTEASLAAIFVIAKIPALRTGGKYIVFA